MAGKDRKEYDYLGRCERLCQVRKSEGRQAKRLQRELPSRAQSSISREQPAVEERERVVDPDPEFPDCGMKDVGWLPIASPTEALDHWCGSEGH